MPHVLLHGVCVSDMVPRLHANEQASRWRSRLDFKRLPRAAPARSN